MGASLAETASEIASSSSKWSVRWLLRYNAVDSARGVVERFGYLLALSRGAP